MTYASVFVVITCLVIGGLYLGAILTEKFWNSGLPDWWYWWRKK